MKKLLIFISTIAVVSLTSCLKDKPITDFSSIKGQAVVELPWSGLQYFGLDAITSTNDTIVAKFGINIASATPLTTDTKYTVAVDYSLLTAYQAANSAVTYETAMPDGSYTINKLAGTIKAGQRLDSITVTFYKSKLDPSKSYMLPIKLASASNGILSGNFNAHYYHFIGNDFAGSYVWDYRRWNNGTGPGAGIIPSQNPGNVGIPADITGIGQAGTIIPITPTEFQMLTGYNGTGVNYDVTFTRTVTNGVVTYSNWSVQFLPEDIAKWTAAGISNVVPPSFTIPPPAKKGDPKIFEINYVSGGASGRYIDDTYHP